MSRSAAEMPVHLPSDTPRRSSERALIDAALAVNEAGGLDEAFDLLVRVGKDLLDADRVSVVVWDEGLERGVIRAAAGTAEDDGVGGIVLPGESGVYLAAKTGEPVVRHEASTDGLDPRVRSAISQLAAYVVVPNVVDGATPLTFQAGWNREVAPETLDAAIELLAALGSLTRIAYRMEQERGTARARASFDTVVHSVADGIVVRTKDGLTLNATARRLLELDDASPIDVDGTAEVDGELTLTPPELLALLAVEPAEERAFRRRVALPSGREVFLDGKVAPIQEPGGPGGAVAVFRDVTAEHNREFLTEQLLEKLFDTLPVAIVLAEPAKREVLSANAALLGLIGYSEEEVVGRRPPYPWLEVESEVERLAEAPREQPLETLFRHKDGRLIPVEIKIFEIPGPDGESVAVVALITDRSEQRRFEQQLVQSGKLATIGELAAGVAHEINNPLFAILGLVEFLLKEIEPGTKAHDRLTLVQQTGLEIKEIVRALLDFAREPSEERALVSVRDVARETIELISRTSSAKAIELVEDYTEESTLVDGSPNQLKQIFLNLVTNASQELRGEGTVEIAVRREGDRVVATVSDNGRGIPHEVLERIFEPFYTTKRGTGGSGLGLSVSHGIAAAHGGSLTAENRPEGGARFTLSLPAREGS